MPPVITSPRPTGGGVGRGVAHAAALVGIEREIRHLDQHLAVLGLGHRHFLDPEVRFGRLAGRPPHEHHTTVCLGKRAHAPAPAVFRRLRPFFPFLAKLRKTVETVTDECGMGRSKKLAGTS
jgi:hypothetical protein